MSSLSLWMIVSCQRGRFQLFMWNETEGWIIWSPEDLDSFHSDCHWSLRLFLSSCLISVVVSGNLMSMLHFCVAFFAIWSAFSLPFIPQWPGIHSNITLLFCFLILMIVWRISHIILLLAKGCEIACIALRQSEKIQVWIGWTSSIHSTAIRIANSSAVKIEISLFSLMLLE